MVSEPTAKLKVTVKLVQPALAELPEPGVPTKPPLSVARLAVAVVLVLAAAYGGRWLYQFWPQAGIDYSAYAAPADEPTDSTAENSSQTHTQPSSLANSAEAQQQLSSAKATTAPSGTHPAVSANTKGSGVAPESLSSVQTEPTQTERAQVVVTDTTVANTAIANTSIVNNEQPSALDTASTAQPNAGEAAHAQLQTGVPITDLPLGFRRIVFTAHMERLEPGAPVAEPVPFNRVKRVYLFTEVEGFAGQILHHRWYWNNQFQYEARLTVEDSPWRTYSEKWLLDDQRGTWRVEIIDQAQNVLYQHDFTYQ